MKPGLILSALALCAVAGAALAQPVRKDDACAADVQKFCRGVRPGSAGIARCLAQREAELSEACRAKIGEGRQRAEGFAAACRSDAEQLCRNVRPGEGRMLRCLSDQRERLSSACRDKIAEGDQRNPCRVDAARLCRDATGSRGALTECLQRNEAQLSPPCKARLAEAREEVKKGRP